VSLAAASAALALAVAAPSASYWPAARVLDRIDGTSVRVGGRAVRVHSDTALCSGYGGSVRRHGIRMWRDFECTYTTFTKTGVDRDLEFRVHVVDARRFRVSDARWVPIDR
jgi:hypothetical protein